MIRPTVARVDLGALKSNYRLIVEHLATEGAGRVPGVIAVVKANAYGHGAGQVALALEEAGADVLACADIEEGAALRAAGVRAEILVFGALSVHDLDARRRAVGASRVGKVSASAALSPEDRHRHESPRVPLRQPAPHAAGAPGEPESRSRRGLHALRDRRRAGVAAVQRSASTLRACVEGDRRHEPRSTRRPQRTGLFRDLRALCG